MSPGAAAKRAPVAAARRFLHGDAHSGRVPSRAARDRAATAALVLLALAALAPHAAAAPAVTEVALHVSPRFAFANATLLGGALAFAEAEIRDVGFVDAHALVLPAGTLVACPRGGGTAPPSVADPEQPCRGARAFENPRLTFGARTGLSFRDALVVERFPAASFGLLVPASGRTTWATTLSPDGLSLSPGGDLLRFEPVGRSAEVVVDAEGETVVYNGTTVSFTFRADEPGAFTVLADAAHAEAGTSLTLRLAPGPRDAFRAAFRPRVLLDAQEAVLGAAGRDPVRNLTAVVGAYARVPHLLNGAILGHLNGTAAGASFSPDRVAFVRAPRLEATLGEDGLLAGTSEAVFYATTEGFAPVGGTVWRPPWILGGILWAVALATLALVPAARFHRAYSDTGRDLLAFALAFVLWDLAVWRALGASGGTALWNREPFGATGAFLAFELVAFVLAFLVLALPVRLALRRLARRYVPRLLAATGPVTAVALLAYAAAAPFSLLALGYTVARL